IDAAGRNTARGFPDAALFEIGPAFTGAKPGAQQLVAAVVRQGHQGPRHWSGTSANRDNDLYDAKADALAVIDSCGMPTARLQVSADAPAWYHPKRSGSLRAGANVLAWFGEIHPALLDEMGVKGPVAAVEVFLDNIPVSRKSSATAKPLLKLSPFQPVARDFAFIVPRALPAEDIVRAAQNADKNLVDRVDLFDIYEGKGVDDGMKSVAINVVFQPQEQTMTDAEIENLCKKVVDGVTEKTGGRLRA
ncbi:MAG TPA: phenylalanine--tRNA ligase subunit beta, partial [Alphaproteobacteria bacterium]